MKRIDSYLCDSCPHIELSKSEMEKHEKFKCSVTRKSCTGCKYFLVGTIKCGQGLPTEQIRSNCHKFESKYAEEFDGK